MENNKLVICNHKNYMNLSEVSKYLKKANEKITTKQVVICPSSIYIPYFLKHEYEVGAQNVEIIKPFTGEITTSQVSELGVNYVIVGHSERIKHFEEDEQMIHDKVVDVLKHHLKAVVCVGETMEEKNLFKTEKALKRQLITYLKKLSAEQLKDVIIAYEPVWTVGTNKNLTLAELKKNVRYIKDFVKKIYSIDIPVLYGGSINANNIEKFNKMDDVDGFLIGEASTDISEVLKIIEVVVPQ